MPRPLSWAAAGLGLYGGSSRPDMRSPRTTGAGIPGAQDSLAHDGASVPQAGSTTRRAGAMPPTARSRDLASLRPQPRRHGHDFWATPRCLTEALIRHVLPELPTAAIWE